MIDSIVDRLRHDAFYYRDLCEFVTTTAGYIREGAEAGEPCLVAAPAARLLLIQAELGDAADRVRFVDMAAVGRNPNRILTAVLRPFVDQHRPTRVRIVAESIFLERSVEAVAAGVRHEALVNHTFAGADVTIFCPLDVAALGHLIPYAERTHPSVVTPEGRRPSSGYTDPLTMVALLNQPLPEPRRTVEATSAATAEAVRRLVATQADKAGLSVMRSADLQRAAVELAAVTAASTVRIWVEPDRLVCEVRGGGQAVALMSGRLVPDPGSPRGRALASADALCDLVQTHVTASAGIFRLHMRLTV